MKRVNWLVLCSVLAAAGLLARWWVWGYVSADVEVFLIPWVRHLDLHGFAGIATTDANYNPPYLYLLYLVRQLLPWLSIVAAVKTVSVVFDLLLAAVVYRVLSTDALHTSEHPRRLALLGALAVFCLPTVVLNSSAWGQSDVIYSTFLLFSLYCFRQGRELGSAAMAATALAFKLQMVFAGSVVGAVILVAQRRYAMVVTGCLVYLAWITPAILAGRGVGTTLGTYLRQGEGAQLSYGAPNLWGVFSYIPLPNSVTQPYVRPAILVGLLAFLALLAFSWYVLKRRREYVYELAFTSTFFVVFLLPNMHERYFFFVDVLGVLLLFRHGRLWMAPVCVCAASLLTYIPYLSDISWYRLLAFAILLNFVAVASIVLFWRRLARRVPIATSWS